MSQFELFAAKKEAAEKVAEGLKEQHDAAQAAAKKSPVVVEEAPEPVAKATSSMPQPAQVTSPEAVPRTAFISMPVYPAESSASSTVES